MNRHPTERWTSYLARFHDDHPGVTERILRRCTSRGIDPYEWTADPLDDVACTLDVASGSGPMADHLRGWMGLDTSASELAVAAVSGRRPLVRASATALPVRSQRMPASVCTMGLQVVQPMEVALDELARVTEPGGRVVVLLPAARPIPPAHVVVYLRLQLALRARIRYPNDRQMTTPRLRALAAARGLEVLADERRAFDLPLRTDADADDLVRSLYLPDVTEARLAAARRVIRRRVGTSLTVPLRRVVLERTMMG